DRSAPPPPTNASCRSDQREMRARSASEKGLITSPPEAGGGLAGRHLARGGARLTARGAPVAGGGARGGGARPRPRGAARRAPGGGRGRRWAGGGRERGRRSDGGARARR